MFPTYVRPFKYYKDEKEAKESWKKGHDFQIYNSTIHCSNRDFNPLLDRIICISFNDKGKRVDYVLQEGL